MAESNGTRAIAPGTLCWLTRIAEPQRFLVGRVVEVVDGPREEFGDGPGPYYGVRASWIEITLIVVREQLIPIARESRSASEWLAAVREPA